MADLIATTSTTDVRPLGDSWSRNPDLVRGILRERLGPDHAALLAEPIHASRGTGIDWYAESAVGAVPVMELASEARTEVLTRLAAYEADIRALADRLAASGSADERRLAVSLRNAVEVPSERSVYAVPGSAGWRPILVEWASVLDRADAPRGVLAAMIPKPPPAPQPGPSVINPVSVAQPPRSGLPGWLFWLGWVMLAVNLDVILWLLVAACGLRGLPWLHFCPAPAVAPAADRSSDILRNEIAQLERRLAEAQRLCVPEPPPPPPPPPPPRRAERPEPPEPAAPADKPAQSDIDRRLSRENAQRGDTEISLAWGSKADLDLHVFCPTGERVYFQRRSAARCGAKLDVDQNFIPNRAITDPVEHVILENPPSGTYRVAVVLFNPRLFPASQSFTVRIRMGSHEQTLSGSVSAASPIWKTSFNYSGQP
jgi:hypothetical protein